MMEELLLVKRKFLEAELATKQLEQKHTKNGTGRPIADQIQALEEIIDTPIENPAYEIPIEDNQERTI